MRLGLFGGRFDPPHIGHLLAAQSAVEVLALDELWFIPAKSPPHKPAVASAPERLEMTTLATASNPVFRVSELELARPGPSYTIDTVMAVRAQHPSRALYFITGYDAYADIASWHRATELVETVSMVALARPGYNVEGLEAPFAERVQRLDTRLCDVSSTEIRHRLSRALSVRYLVPEAVEMYLDQSDLYRQ